ncbi:hypothetical protein E3Q18_02577 [Wallemia mellicola]|nr:hypothetical protein E3Q18_02577 [Wallemia mellicola]
MLGYEPAPLMPTAAVPGILIVSASGRDVAGFVDIYEDAMASAKERWSIPNDLVFRLGVKKKDAPGYLANTAQGDLIILGDDAVYQLVKMGKARTSSAYNDQSVLRTEIQVYASKEVKPKEESKWWCFMTLIDRLTCRSGRLEPPPPPPEPVENSKGKMFRLDTKALPDINMDWSQSQGGQSMVGSFLGQLTIKPQTDPEGRITFSGKEIPNGRCRTTTVHSLRFKFRFELLHIYKQQECAVGMTDYL